VGALNEYKGYTPFLDSLAQHSLVFNNAFASAERSNKALPAIIAGIPSLMDDPFMYSVYQDNCIQGIGDYLQTKGYHTSFFHGGINGEFNIDALSPAAGFNLYFGKNEFNDDTYFDGHWGIYDEEFMQYFSKTLNDFPQPFCTALFTVSSHDPFPIPAKYKGKFPKGETDIQESIGYTDFSLRKFFEKASQESWYANTLFVITSDHTFQYGKRLAPRYENRAGYFSIPLFFFTPDSSLTGRSDQLVQHTDIIPSVLDYLRYDGIVNAFGTSVFSDSLDRTAIQYLDNLYQIENDQYCLLYDGTRAIGLYKYLEDFHFEKNLLLTEKLIAEKLTKKLEAMLQTYNKALIMNKLCVERSGRSTG
jgi:phosphoglycerol transferase MdoB-like AlkP superfamily enzyme